EVGTLLAVDLDAHEALVHQRGRGLVLERLVFHHVTPVARRVADREQDRPVLFARARERLVAPRIPIHGVTRVLQEVRARRLGQAVHACTVLPWLFRAGPSRFCSPTSRARRRSSSGSATTTPRSSRITGAFCATSSSGPTGVRSTRRATRSSIRSRAREKPSAPPWTASGRSPATPGRMAPRCAYGWASTRASRPSATRATSGSTSSARPGSAR